MTRLLPALMRPWRCHPCGARHNPIDTDCPHTNIPKDHTT